jgi:glutaredoxin-like protein
MTFLPQADREVLERTLSGLAEPVRLVFFTQTFGCEACAATGRILAELASLSERIALEEHNLVLEKDLAAEYGIDRAPTVVVTREGGRRLTYVGAPAGYEFAALVEAVKLVSSGDSGLSEENRARLEGVSRPMTIAVFVTPTCVYCPQAVTLAWRLAIENANIRALAIEASEFPDLARRYRVSGVPKTIVDDRIEIFGALPEDQFVDQVLQEPDTPTAA